MHREGAERAMRGLGAIGVAGAVLLALSPLAARLAIAQDAPDPGPPSGGGGVGIDLGPLLGGLGGVVTAVGDLRGWLGARWQDFLAVVAWTLGMAPRLGAMAILVFIGVFADALIKGFGLAELGSILTQVPEGPLQEGWVQVLVVDAKGIAFVLLPAAFGARAVAWNVGLSREDLGELLRDLFVAGVLIATIDGWALLTVRALNALSAGLSGGSAALAGAADAAQMARQASLPLSFAPFPGDGDVQRALQQAADASAAWAEAMAAAGLMALIWAVVGLVAAGAAILRDLVVVLLFVLAPLTPLELVMPWAGGIFRAWWAVFLGTVGVQLVPALLLRAGTVALLSGLLPSQADTTSLWSVFVGAVAILGSALFLWRGALGGARVTVGTARTAKQAAVAGRAAVVRAAPVVARVAAPVVGPVAVAAGRVPLVGGVVQRVLPAARPPAPAAAPAAVPAGPAPAPARAGAAVPSRRGP